MQTVKKGQLFQYTQEHYGKFYKGLPNLPFSVEYSVLGIGADYLDKTPWFFKTKKYTLFAAKVVTVYHPMTKVLKCDYVFCYISDPHQNSETREGWVRANWIEPLTTFQSYEAESLSTVQGIFEEMKKRQKEEPPERELTPLEIFQQKIKGRKR